MTTRGLSNLITLNKFSPLEASLSLQSRRHEQSTPSQVEEIYGQEVIIEIKWWQTCPRNIVGI